MSAASMSLKGLRIIDRITSFISWNSLWFSLDLEVTNILTVFDFANIFNKNHLSYFILWARRPSMLSNSNNRFLFSRSAATSFPAIFSSYNFIWS